jgi:hypothetical protein
MSASTKANTVIVERHRYVADWLEIDKVELDLKDTVYEFNYRFGPDWYLESRRYDGKDWVDVDFQKGRERSFRIHNPAQALKDLGGNVTKFTTISSDMHFHEALSELLADAGVRP